MAFLWDEAICTKTRQSMQGQCQFGKQVPNDPIENSGKC